jgi:hypothetical protein
MRALTVLVALHSLNPHDFGCICGRWTYRVGTPNWGIDIEGHLIHVAEVIEAAVREQIANQIRAAKTAHPMTDNPPGWYSGMGTAERIARGEFL